jgi:hypothetical protein
MYKVSRTRRAGTSVLVAAVVAAAVALLGGANHGAMGRHPLGAHLGSWLAPEDPGHGHSLRKALLRQTRERTAAAVEREQVWPGLSDAGPRAALLVLFGVVILLGRRPAGKVGVRLPGGRAPPVPAI